MWSNGGSATVGSESIVYFIRKPVIQEEIDQKIEFVRAIHERWKNEKDKERNYSWPRDEAWLKEEISEIKADDRKFHYYNPGRSAGPKFYDGTKSFGRIAGNVLNIRWKNGKGAWHAWLWECMKLNLETGELTSMGYLFEFMSPNMKKKILNKVPPQDVVKLRKKGIIK